MHIELETIKTNIQTQNHENGSTENVTVNNILTIQEENQDTITGSAPTDNQEEGAGSAPIDNQEEHTESSPTKVSQGWWPFSRPSNEEDLDTMEDNTTQEILALEKRLGSTITSLEQRVKTMEAGLQNMKPELGAAPSDKEALDRRMATKQELQVSPTEANEENTVEEACKNYSTEVKSNIQNIAKKHNETVEYLSSLAYSYVEILKLLSDLERCRSFRELSNRIAQDTPIFIEYEYLSSNLNYLKCFNGQK